MSVPVFDTIEQEVEHLRKQVSDLQAHNNQALAAKRIVALAGDYCLDKWGRDYKARGRKLLEESAELMVRLSNEWELKQHGKKAVCEEIGDVQIVLWSIARLLEVDATECALDKFPQVVAKFGVVTK